jgi:hypothetical protein
LILIVNITILPKRYGTRRPVDDGMPLEIEDEVIMKSLGISHEDVWN